MMKQITPLFDLTGKVAIVTGASKGIGAAIARGLAEFGAQVVLSSRSAETIDALVAAFQADGLAAHGIPCHVGDAVQRENLVAETMQRFGRIDILVNNAATNPTFGAFETTTEAAFDKVMEINVKAPMLLSNLVFPIMKAQGDGAIVHISSVEGLKPGAGLGAYAISKSALIMLAQTQAKEWGGYGIRSNVICPGLVKTKFSEALWKNEKLMATLLKALPVHRMAEPEEMAGLAVLLAAPAGRYMTGGVYTADGGYMIAG